MPRELVGRPMEILLVEDSLVDARLTIRGLEKGGFKHRLTLTCDGREALDFLQRKGVFAQAPRPDLILLDLHLPQIDGFELLSEIRADPQLTEIPVVVLTNSDSAEDRYSVQQLQVESYITKPVDFEKFVEVVRELRDCWHESVILPRLD